MKPLSLVEWYRVPQTQQPIEVYCSRSSLLFGMVICLVVVLALALVTFASLTF